MEEFLSLEISEGSSTPKYKQIVKSIIGKIEADSIKYGQKLPSINKLSFDYILARDTVEKAYNELKKQGVIESVKGKGYYIKNTNPQSRLKILVLFNKLSSYKKVIFNRIASELSEKAHLDLFIYHCSYEIFSKILRERLTDYNYYIIMPHFIQYDLKEFDAILKQLPKEKILLLDHQIDGVDHFHSIIYQDFKMDIYDALVSGIEQIKKYERLVLVFPENQNYPYPKEIILGFRRFCSFHQVQFEITNEIKPEDKIEKQVAYIIIEETDLVNLIKQARAAGLQLGQDVGIISYNDTPLKEVLVDGISVITTNFEKMGQEAAKAILDNKPIKLKNDFELIPRNTL
ncbi:GntR family transcriptional regulator [Reichenbachiella ulvae]|uniref:GntR family transcriptional regulator n=1 Tax=Reichenbachiella ulvae TaxID=2980104 RepID=A0ABT3CYY9_9BACT|nr:GntR family transcriptional regulator [Reichenbachiella ulvae]MCV9388915.1 GntR family transcriptional regulator [Reichenbachiella ulvae]